MSVEEVVERLSLKEYQRLIREHAQFDKNLLLFHSTGSGKTITAFALFVAVRQYLPAGTRLVVSCTRSTVDHWQEQFRHYQERFGGPHFPNNLLEVLTHGQTINNPPEGPYVFVLDEAHNFRATILSGNPPSPGVQTSAMLDIAARAQRVYLLTATPVWNHPAEAATLYAMLLGTADAGDVQTFHSAFRQAGEQRDSAMFARWFRCLVSYFRSRADEAGFPRIREERITEPMTREEFGAYGEVLRTRYIMREGVRIDQHSFNVGQRQAVNVPSKTNWVVNRVLDNALSGQQTVVYSAFLEAGTNVLSSALANLEVPYSWVTGRSTPAQRRESIRRYNAGESKVFFLSSAGSEGIHLENTANVIIYEPHFNEAQIRQVVGRTARRGSHQNLPLHQQEVLVTKLCWTVPDGVEDVITTDTQLLHDNANKTAIIDAFEEGLRQASIEHVGHGCRTVAVTWEEPFQIPRPHRPRSAPRAKGKDKAPSVPRMKTQTKSPKQKQEDFDYGAAPGRKRTPQENDEPRGNRQRDTKSDTKRRREEADREYARKLQRLEEDGAGVGGPSSGYGKTGPSKEQRSRSRGTEFPSSDYDRGGPSTGGPSSLPGPSRGRSPQWDEEELRLAEALSVAEEEEREEREARQRQMEEDEAYARSFDMQGGRLWMRRRRIR